MAVPVSAADGEGSTAGQAYSRGSRGLTPLQTLMLLASLAALTILPALTIVVTAKLLRQGKTFVPEIVLPVILIVGLISLLGVLVSLVAIYRRFGLDDPRSALGMPAGSIQAVIALSLILIFAIVGVYLHGISGQVEDRTSTGLTRAQVDALPPNSIVRIHRRSDKKFDVKRSIPTATAQQNDISKQLLTTISTLVVAVAGFYFGSKSVKEATEAVVGRREDGGTGVDGSTDEDGGGDDEADEDEAALNAGDVDEAAIYGDQSGVTGLSADDLDEALEGPPLVAEGETTEPLDPDGDDDDEEADEADMAAERPEDREPGEEA
jgi:hypothetical protein